MRSIELYNFIVPIEAGQYFMHECLIRTFYICMQIS